jgi:hypothetical protein
MAGFRRALSLRRGPASVGNCALAALVVMGEEIVVNHREDPYRLAAGGARSLLD